MQCVVLFRCVDKIRCVASQKKQTNEKTRKHPADLNDDTNSALLRHSYSFLYDQGLCCAAGGAAMALENRNALTHTVYAPRFNRGKLKPVIQRLESQDSSDKVKITR